MEKLVEKPSDKQKKQQLKESIEKKEAIEKIKVATEKRN